MNLFQKIINHFKAIRFVKKVKEFEDDKISAKELLSYTDIPEKENLDKRLTLYEDACAIIDAASDQVDIPERQGRKKYIRDEQCNTVIDPKLNLGNEGYFKQWEEGEITEEEFLRKSKMNLKMVEILYTRMGRIAQFEKARRQRIKVN